MKSYSTQFFLCFLTCALFAQTADVALVQYKQNFVLGNITEKNSILESAVKNGGNFADLYTNALRFSAENKALLQNNTDLTTVTLSALAGLQTCPPDNAYLPLFWTIFSAFPEDSVKTAVITTLSKGKYNSTDTVSRLNAYVSSQAALEAAKRDAVAFDAGIKTMGEIAASSSFSALFTVLTAAVSENTFLLAQTAINNIRQDYEQNTTRIIDGNYSAQNKLIIFRTALKNSALSVQTRGEIAQKTLSMSITINEGIETSETVRLLRQESLREIYTLRRIQAAPTVINYFILAQKEFKNGKLAAEPFIEIIACLGVLPTADASKVLSGYLAALNTQAELNGVFNEKVVLAVITALGTLGDKSSFDTLLYVNYIQNYPESITEAARDALARFKW